MAEELRENEIPPEQPSLQMSFKGYAYALMGVVIVGGVIGLVLRYWG